MALSSEMILKYVEEIKVLMLMMMMMTYDAMLAIVNCWRTI